MKEHFLKTTCKILHQELFRIIIADTTHSQLFLTAHILQRPEKQSQVVLYTTKALLFLQINKSNPAYTLAYRYNLVVAAFHLLGM